MYRGYPDVPVWLMVDDRGVIRSAAPADPIGPAIDLSPGTTKILGDDRQDAAQALHYWTGEGWEDPDCARNFAFGGRPRRNRSDREGSGGFRSEKGKRRERDERA